MHIFMYICTYTWVIQVLVLQSMVEGSTLVVEPLLGSPQYWFPLGFLLGIASYCWWFRNPAPIHMVDKLPLLNRVFIHPRWFSRRISSINSSKLPTYPTHVPRQRCPRRAAVISWVLALPWRLLEEFMDGKCLWCYWSILRKGSFWGDLGV